MNNLDTSVLEREDVFSQHNNDELAGYTYSNTSKARQSVEEAEILVGEQDLLTSDRENIRNNKWLHLVSTLIIGSLFAVLAYVCFSIFGKIMTAGQEKPAGQHSQLSTVQQKSQARIKTLEEQIDHKNAQLAFNKKDTSQWQKIEPKPKPAPVEEQPAPQPEPAASPSPVVPQQQPQQPTAESINPLEEWSRLSAIGTANGENQIGELAASTSENRADNSEVETIPRVTPPESSPTAMASPSIADTIPTSSPEEVPNLGIKNGEVTDIASVAIGTTEAEPETRSNSSGFNLNDPEVANLISDAPPTNSYLEEKKKQYRQEDRLKELSSLGSASATVDRGTQATLVADASSDADISSKRIPLGNSVRGELANDIVLSEGLDLRQSRGIIHISEPLFADDGSIALPENSAIIVEAQAVNTSGLVQLQAVALSYENSSGELVQEALPKGSILIQGKNEALIAERANGSGGSNLGQDILLAGLGAGEKAFDLINEPEVVREGYSGSDYRGNTYDPYNNNNENLYQSDGSNFGNYGNYSTKRSDRSSLATGAAEGAFATTKSRLEGRSSQIQQERQSEIPIFQLKAGTDVSIFINSFLTIEP